MWADPIDSKTGACDTLVKPNEVRGCSYFFGSELTRQFFERNRVMSVIRAH
jgi:serine/threonine-protein phosphatase 2B catalytic subunit